MPEISTDNIKNQEYCYNLSVINIMQSADVKLAFGSPSLCVNLSNYLLHYTNHLIQLVIVSMANWRL